MLEPEHSPAAEQHPHQYRPDIDGLRAIAVLAVVVFHAQPRLLRGGFIGVDVFFVISGYLITGIILERQKRGKFTIRDFYARRIRRIFPALGLVLAAALVAGWFFLLPSEYADLGKHAAGGAGFVSNLLLWQDTNYFAPDVNAKMLLHLWSLGIEEQYYLVWPLLIVTLWRTRWRLAPITALLAASLALNVYYAAANPRAAFYSPLARLWELLLGSVIAYVILAHGEPLTLFARRFTGVDREKGVREVASVAGLTMILAGFVLISEQSRFPGWWALLPTVGTALLICAGPGTQVGRFILSNRVMVAVGLISYPLYLWHWPALVFLRLQFPEISVVMKLATLGGVFVASWLTYWLVERHVRRARGVAIVSSLCGVLALLLVTGFVVYREQGVPHRGDDVHRRVFEASVHKAREASTPGPGICFIQVGQTSKDFGQKCFPGARTDSSPKTVLLWGDSYAAHLVSGMKEVAPNLHFGWLTGAGCPPVVGYNEPKTPHCNDVDRFITDWIRKNPPDMVLLSANWYTYAHFTDVERTLTFLHDVGVKNVVLVGSYAQFPGAVPRLLLKEASRGTVPAQLPAANLPRLRAADSTLRKMALTHGVSFVSPITEQCGLATCTAALDTGAIGVTTFDNGHLTQVGSAWLVRRMLAGYLK